MHRRILLTLLALASGNAVADWERWNTVESKEDFTVYANAATVRRSGNIAQMWDLSDAKAGKVLAGVRQSRSFKSEREYDCSTQQVRMLYLSWHSGNMGKGEIIGSSANPGGWQPALLGTIGEKLWNIACGLDRGRRF